MANGTIPLIELAGRVRECIVPLARELRRTDGEFTPTQLSVLGAILRRQPVTLGDLAAGERLSPARISRIVASLVEAGMVDRLPDRSDRRVCRVRISAAGEQWITEGRARRDAALAARLRTLDGAELATLRDAVSVLERLTFEHG